MQKEKLAEGKLMLSKVIKFIFLAVLLHKNYISHADEELRQILDDILRSLNELECMHLHMLLASPKCFSAPGVLRHLNISLESMCGHLMTHGSATSVHFAYLSLIAELTQSGLKDLGGEGLKFVRSSSLSDMSKYRPFPSLFLTAVFIILPLPVRG